MLHHSDEPLEEKEYPDEADVDELEDEYSSLRVVHCPACGELVYEQAQQCPHCKQWVALGSGGWRDSKKWYVRGGLYLTKTLLLNWLFWLALAAVAAAAAAWRMFR